MKTTATILCGLMLGVFNQTAMATDPINAYQPGAVWEYAGRLDSDPFVEFASRYYFEGATELNDSEYLNLFEDFQADDPEISASVIFKGGVRNDGGKIYLLPEDCEREFLIFDFTLQPGEETQVYRGDWNFRQNPNPEPVNIKCLNRYEVQSGSGTVEMMDIEADYAPSEINKWIVGIGTSISPLTNLYAQVGGLSGELIKVTIDNEVVYLPSPSGVGAVVNEEKKSEVRYNLDGSLFRDGDTGICITSDGKRHIRR